MLTFTHTGIARLYPHFADLLVKDGAHTTFNGAYAVGDLKAILKDGFDITYTVGRVDHSKADIADYDMTMMRKGVPRTIDIPKGLKGDDVVICAMHIALSIADKHLGNKADNRSAVALKDMLNDNGVKV